MENQYWRYEVLDLTLSLIYRAGHTRWPQSLDDWSDVADRFCLRLVIARALHPNVLMDNTIVVRASSRPHQMTRRIAHEITEYLLTSEWEAPYHVPPEETAQARHRIAQTVENLLSGYDHP
jgi:hypothetical protein